MSAKAIPDLSGGTFGYPEEPSGEIYDARNSPPGGPMGAFADAWGIGFAEVRCTTRYARWLTNQEQWERSGSRDAYMEMQVEERPGVQFGADGGYLDEHGDPIKVPEPPERVPDDWEADEHDSVWTFCASTHPDAVKVYSCEPKAAT